VQAAPSAPPPTPVGPGASPSPFPTVLHTPAAAVPPPSISAPAAVLEDLDSGQVLFARGAGVHRPIASVTKIITALLVLERLPLSATITASPRAAAEPGATLGLEPGERMRVRDGLYALLLASADDVAVALAERVSRSVGAFVDLMNRRAAELGLRHSKFASPDGYDSAGFSTARDVASLARTAMANPTFAAIVRTKRASVRSRTGPLRVVQNRNVLLWLYRGAIGVKTGHTSAAGHCVVAAAERDGVRLLAVVLGAPEDAFSDAAALLNHGFAAFRRSTLAAQGGRLGTLSVGGRPVPVLVGATLTALVPRSARVRLVLREAPGLTAPIAAGVRVGTLTAYAGSHLLGSVPAVAGRAPPATTGTSPAPLPAEAAVRTTIGVLDAFARSVFGGFL